MQVDNSVSRKDMLNTRRYFLPSLKMRPCGMRHKSGKKRYRQNRSAAMFLLCSSFLEVVSTLFMFLETGV